MESAHKIHECGECNYKSYSEDDLTEHRKSIHIKFPCINCRDTFSNKKELDDHSKSVQQFPCHLILLA